MLLEYLSLFWEFFKIGSFTLGGGVAMIPQMQDIAVNEKKWVDEQEMLDCIAVAQSLPGIVAVNTATYIGYRKAGLAGAVISTAGVVLPAYLAIVIAYTFLDHIGDNKFVEGAFTGIKAGVCGLIFVTATNMFRQIVRGGKDLIFSLAVCLLAVVAVAFFDITAVIIILSAILAGLAYNFIKRGLSK